MPKESFQQSNQSEVLQPSFRQEDQEMAEELGVMVVGPPAYASPDPRTNTGRLVPIEEHPLAADLSPDYGGSVANVETAPLSTQATEGAAMPSDRDEWDKSQWQRHAASLGLGTSGSVAKVKERVAKHEADNDDSQRLAGDWKNDIENATSEETLDQLRVRYNESGADFSTVNDAFEDRYAEFEEAENK